MERAVLRRSCDSAGVSFRWVAVVKARVVRAAAYSIVVVVAIVVGSGRLVRGRRTGGSGVGRRETARTAWSETATAAGVSALEESEVAAAGWKMRDHDGLEGHVEERGTKIRR